MFSGKRAWWALALVVLAGSAAAQDSVPTVEDEEQRRRWMEVYVEEAAKYQMFRLGNDREELDLVPTPILTYTNPVRVRDTHGATFVWTSDGRPEVVGAIWSVITPDDDTQRYISHELHSLSLVPIESRHEPRIGNRGPVPDWASEEPGIERKRIPDVDAPAKSATLRLAQMRQLARRFEASFPPGSINAEGSLRLLAQPLYRYQSERHGVMDGGLFAFVMGTDPELILLIEAVESAGGHEWQFAAASFTNPPLQLDYQGVRVWESPRAVPYVGDRAHFLYWRMLKRDRFIE